MALPNPSRRILIPLALAVVVGAVALVMVFRSGERTAEIVLQTERQPLDDTRGSDRERGLDNEWGGALNSVTADGDGFFDREKARAFVAKLAPEESKYVIQLHARALLPLPGKSVEGVLTAPLVEGPGVRGERVAYLQFKEHPTDEQRAQLKARGVELLSYVSAYAWSARATPAAFAAALKDANVRALAAPHARDRLHPEVALTTEVPDYAKTDDGRARYMLLAQPGTAGEDVAKALAEQKALKAEVLRPHQSVLGPVYEIAADSEAGAALALAALPQASYLQYVPPPAESRDATTDEQHNIKDVRDSGPLLTGNGVRVAVREIGRPTTHNDFAGRLQYLQNGVSVASEIDHATAVCGQIASNGIAQPGARGVAPNASLLAYAVGDVAGETFKVDDVVDAASKGARISNHSYGPSGTSLSFGDYRIESANWDDAIRNQNLVGFFANFESGTPPGFIKTDWFVGAKNTICVNASTATAHAGDSLPPTPKAEGIAAFNGFGTMNDGRVKPDLAAFGDSVTLCNGTTGIVTKTGTSFATPACTGVAALVFQQFKAKAGVDPSAALTKALLCNTATDLGNPGPDAQYGFGLLNAEEAISIVNQRVSATVGPFVEGVLSNGQTFSFTAKVEGGSPLRATLCWMDPAGTPSVSTPVLVNNLDMELVAPDGTTKHFPWSLSAASPSATATRTGPNALDPIEQTVVDTPATGTWTITIKGTSIPSGSQSFAVVLNQATEPLPLVPVILASPKEGGAPLSVSFSASASTGNIVDVQWTFGDGSNGSGTDVVHTYAAPGVYTATLFLVDTRGRQAATSVVITVVKRSVEVFPSKATGRLDFKNGRDKLMFTLVVKDLVRTRQEVREAILDGSLENQSYEVRIGGTRLTTFKTDTKGQFKSPSESLKLNLTRGEITITLNASRNLRQILETLGFTDDPASTGNKAMPVEVETSDAVYKATFLMTYKNTRGTSGTLKAP